MAESKGLRLPAIVQGTNLEQIRARHERQLLENARRAQNEYQGKEWATFPPEAIVEITSAQVNG